VGGALEIDSAPGRGTSLSLRIPIPDVRVSTSTAVGSHEVTA